MADTCHPVLVFGVVLLESCVCQAVQRRIGWGNREGMQTTLKAAEWPDPLHVETHIHNRLFPLPLSVYVTPCP